METFLQFMWASMTVAFFFKTYQYIKVSKLDSALSAFTFGCLTLTATILTFIR